MTCLTRSRIPVSLFLSFVQIALTVVILPCMQPLFFVYTGERDCLNSRISCLKQIRIHLTIAFLMRSAENSVFLPQSPRSWPGEGGKQVCPICTLSPKRAGKFHFAIPLVLIHDNWPFLLPITLSIKCTHFGELLAPQRRIQDSGPQIHGVSSGCDPDG